MNKKASLSDTFFISIIIFVIGISVFLMNYMTHQVTDRFLNNTMINASVRASTALTQTANISNRFDYLFMGVFIGLILGMIVTSYFISGHPLFMFVYFLGELAILLVSFYLANIWETVTRITIFGTTYMNFPIADYVIIKLPFIMLGVILLSLIVMFAKPGSGDGA